jgi:hypothetical protein
MKRDLSTTLAIALAGAVAVVTLGATPQRAVGDGSPPVGQVSPPVGRLSPPAPAERGRAFGHACVSVETTASGPDRRNPQDRSSRRDRGSR